MCYVLNKGGEFDVFRCPLAVRDTPSLMLGGKFESSRVSIIWQWCTRTAATATRNRYSKWIYLCKCATLYGVILYISVTLCSSSVGKFHPRLVTPLVIVGKLINHTRKLHLISLGRRIDCLSKLVGCRYSKAACPPPRLRTPLGNTSSTRHVPSSGSLPFSRDIAPP